MKIRNVIGWGAVLAMLTFAGHTLLYNKTPRTADEFQGHKPTSLPEVPPDNPNDKKIDAMLDQLDYMGRVLDTEIARRKLLLEWFKNQEKFNTYPEGKKK